MILAILQHFVAKVRENANLKKEENHLKRENGDLWCKARSDSSVIDIYSYLLMYSSVASTGVMEV